jgi:serine phosphatase RsbU (regulator of sigma subunit)
MGGRSVPLGAFVHHEQRAQATESLRAGDVVVLYTDGLVERRDSPIGDGIELLRRTLAGLVGGTPEQVRDAVLEQLLPARVDDDVALLVVSADLALAVHPQPSAVENEVLPAR